VEELDARATAVGAKSIIGVEWCRCRWLNGLNPFCRPAVEHDLHAAGPDLFVKYWTSIRDTLQKLERDFGPSDNWL